jgi:hypothetical protein
MSNKKQEKIKEAQKKKLKKIIGWVSVLILLFGGFSILMYVAIQQNEPQGQDFSEEIALGENANQHVALTEELEITALPPTSGPHFGQVATAGMRNEEIPDGHLIHNLEHGDIWISYNPAVSETIVDELRQFLDGKVVITPRSMNEQDIVLAAWGRLDSFNIEESGLPEERIRDFIKRYKYSGPERITSPSRGI